MSGATMTMLTDSAEATAHQNDLALASPRYGSRHFLDAASCFATAFDIATTADFPRAVSLYSCCWIEFLCGDEAMKN